jgi:hypothetical protein
MNHRYGPFIMREDINTFERRVAEEGLTFLTVVLPKVGKSLDRYHSTSEWVPPLGFATKTEYYCPKYGDHVDNFIGVSIPLFLNRAIKAALEGDSVAVDCVRQLSYVFYKLEVSYSEELCEKFLESFKKIDSELFSLETCSDDNIIRHVNSMSRIIRRILCNTNPFEIRPCHGSGATACRTKPWDKYHTLRYFPKLDAYFPYPHFFFYSLTHFVDEMAALEKSPIANPQARICLVPKDSRGPRVISCEPAEFMYIQQGLMRLLYETIETHHLSSGQINFSDQEVNKSLALVGSLTGALATIDLSEASDRVSLSLVEALFSDNWVNALKACRSESTILPNGEVVELKKFAPMGSSCCFPVEALVFWASAQATLRRLGRTAPVYVYGDDLIFSSEYFDEITKDLTSIGLVVNRDKSYVRGPFRESCGGDYHNGYDVTPVRLKKFLTSNSTALAHNADFCNSLIAKFGYESVHSIVRLIEQESGYAYPRTELPIPLTIRCPKSAMNDVHFKRRFNKSLQRFEYRILTTSNHIRQRRPPNWGELLRKELSRENSSQKPFSIPSPLSKIGSVMEPGQYVDPHSTRTKWEYTWIG